MKFATLLYIKNTRGEYLLIERVKNPNKGYLSPPGGKLKIEDAESAAKCAVREAFEECLIKSKPEDWKLLGIITEKEYPNIGNIMIFCFEYQKKIKKLPPVSNEGKFKFIGKNYIKYAKIPATDKLYIWNFVLRRKSFFSIYIDCTEKKIRCRIEQ